MFNVALTSFNLREISTKNYSDVQRGIDIIQFERDLCNNNNKNYSDVQRGTDIIQFERDLDKELYHMCVQCGTDVIWLERDLNKEL